MGRFNDATKLQKTVCAIISIAAFLLIWFLATNGTELGVVLASPVDVFARFFQCFTEPLGTHTIPGPVSYIHLHQLWHQLPLPYGRPADRYGHLRHWL